MKEEKRRMNSERPIMYDMVTVSSEWIDYGMVMISRSSTEIR